MSKASEPFHRYYDEATNGIHRENTEEFLAKEAREKLFHLGSAIELMDFGCGSADLTAYYAAAFPRILGVDFSDNMLTRARRRLEGFGRNNVDLLLASDRTVWDALGSRRFDVITTAAVAQYFDVQRFAQFNRAAAMFLRPQGRIVHFDIIDPRIYRLVEIGLFRQRPWRFSDLPGSALGLMRIFARHVRDAFRGYPDDIIGYRHHPLVLQSVAEAAGFRVQIVNSMYYEYRYHLVLVPSHSALLGA